jgi:hypothetical protein
MAVMKKKSTMEDPWAKPAKTKPAKPVKVITKVPKKVVQAKPAKNPSAPKPAAPNTGNVKVVPPKKKSLPRGLSNKGGKSSRGGMRGGLGGGIFGTKNK